MKKLVIVAAAVALTSVSSVWAEEHTGLEMGPRLAAAEMGGTSQSSASEAKSLFSDSLKDEVLGISPVVGTVAYGDSTGIYRSRSAVGLLAEFNVIPLVAPEAKDFFVGIATGGLLSHVGTDTSNFFGYDSDNGGGANLAVIPVDLKVGYNISDRVRVSAHGGGNITYRSIASAAQLESDSTKGDSEEWRMLPNVGADLEVGIVRGVALSVRPDVTIADGQNLYVGTVGVVAPLTF